MAKIKKGDLVQVITGASEARGGDKVSRARSSRFSLSATAFWSKA